MNPINLFDYEKLAQKRIEPTIWDYYQGGSDDEVTLRENREVFQRIRLRPRVLVDVSQIDMQATVLGTPIRAPILIAPTACHGFVHPDGECATAQAAEQAGTVMIVSTTATRRLEEIAEATKGPLWFQLYKRYNLRITERLLQRAEAAGYRAIVFTVDVPLVGHRERDIRNQFAAYTQLPNFIGEDISENQAISRHDVETWEMVDHLCSLTTLPFILKGILTAEDALLAVEHHVDGIVVSNHGGRQLDSAITSIEALPEIAAAVDGRCEVYVDGGFRRGTDVLKALALGARAILVGRPILWGLAVNGQEGVQHVLELLYREFELAMILSGCPTLASINRSMIRS